MSDTTDTQGSCSFCGKSHDDVVSLIAGPAAYICDECVQLCHGIVTEKTQPSTNKPVPSSHKPIKPSVIVNELDNYVVEQDYAKKVLAVAIYNHYKRINRIVEDDSDDVELQKSNILLLGPTGCGKTLLAQTLARILNVPFAIVDATNLTEAGYVGEDVENIIVQLSHNADFDIEQAERGIIYIDEIDKVSRKNDNPSITRDVSGEGVQQALLKIIEGTVASIPPKGGRKHPQQDFIHVDTKNILFICGGSFMGLDEIINSRRMTKSIGFAATEKKSSTDLTWSKDIQPKDLLKFGLIPEFVGRLPIIVPLHELSQNALAKIMTEPKNALLKQYEKLFEMEGIGLRFSKDVPKKIAQMATEKNLGARGLRSILEQAMLDIMYSSPDQKNIEEIVINEDVFDANKPPIIHYKKQPKSKQAKSAKHA